jgi:hypothetical protein
MTPSGHTLPADTGQGQQMSMPTTHHGIAVGVDGSPPESRRRLGGSRSITARPSADACPRDSVVAHTDVAPGTDSSRAAGVARAEWP